MKKSKLQFLLVFALALTFFINNSHAYQIKVKIAGLKDSTCYLGYYFGQKSYTPVDTAKLDASGNMVFSGDKPLKHGVYLILIPNSYVELIVKDEQNFKMESDTTGGIVKNMKITGNKECQLFYDFQKKMIEFSSRAKNEKDKAKLDAIGEEVKKYREELFTTNKGTFTVKVLKSAEEPNVPDFFLADGKTKDSLKVFAFYKNHFFDNVDFTDEAMLRTPIFIPRMERYMDELTLQSPDSIIVSIEKVLKLAEQNKEIFKYCVATFTNKYETSQVMCMDKVFVHMAENYYMKGRCFWADTSVVRKITERVEIVKNTLCEVKATNMYCADTSGQYVQLYSLKAPYMVLVFWDADCGHCQKEIPKLFDIYKSKLMPIGVKVYAASIERDDKSWPKFLREKNLFAPGWYNVRDKFNHTDFRKFYDIYSTPVIYIVDENKKIIAKRLGVDQIEDFITRYDKNKKK